jgi:dolichol-phosphate mannosyltransferase
MSDVKEKVIIIIPTHNEALVIADTIQQVFTHALYLDNFTVELLIFDSASTDDTSAIVQALMLEYPGKLHLQKEAQKTGLGAAYLQAMTYALQQLDADIVVEFDADLSHQPKYIPPILDMLKTCDVVVGSRYVAGGRIPSDWGLHRKLLSGVGNYIARLILTTRYQDFTSGFRATRRSILEQILPDNFLSNHFAYKLHLMWLLHQHQAHILEFPIVFVDRKKGASKLPANSIKDALRVLFTIRFRAIKMRLLKQQ